MRPVKILLVENDPDTLSLWDFVGESNDCLLLCDGSLSAQKHMKKINYDVDACILDLALEDGDGISLTEIIRRNESIRSIEKECLIFWFTGYPITKTLETMKAELRVTEIFMKPMDPITLINRVKGYLVGASATA
jgi:DNA-binding response OmpR family regulator